LNPKPLKGLKDWNYTIKILKLEKEYLNE